jgi:hypothetical protein
MPDTVATDQIFEDAKRLGKKPYRVASLPELGIHSPAEFFERMDSLRDRAVAAFEKECYIEYLSLVLLHIEVWLRIYLAGRGLSSGMNIYSDRIFFGCLIRKCADAGMDQFMVDELYFINNWRVDYVHSYLRESFDYSAIESHKPRIAKIPPELMLYVARTTGKTVKDGNEIGSPGDIVILM